MRQEFAVPFLPDECWYGSCVTLGTQMPFTGKTDLVIPMDPQRTVNQAAPLLCSNQGRVLWCEGPFTLTIRDGVLLFMSEHKPRLNHNARTLQDAYLEAQNCYFPPSGKTPAREFFVRPQYNTWIELMYDQNQEGLLDYARKILDQGFPPGVLMIDDGWNRYYGNWEFDPVKFPNPKAMIKKLHDWGFTVMIWTCPFVSPDSPEFRYLEGEGALVKTAQGETSIVHWWNGYSAVLDMTDPKAIAWYDAQNRRLMDEYGVDGFKMDAGDGYFYHDDDRMAVPVGANGQTEAWAHFAARYDFNELRACWKNGGQPLVQRLADKGHNWGEDGVAGLIPNELAQGILGYAFSCPDMIGGGQFTDFLPGAVRFSEELFVRYAQIAALMPMMQFSASPVRVLSAENCETVRQAVRLHSRFADTIWALARHSAETGEPIVRYLEYEFPHQGYQAVTDQFMLGSDIMVAPVTKPGCRERSVVFPQGSWYAPESNTVYEGPCAAEVPAPLEALPYFIRRK